MPAGITTRIVESAEDNLIKLRASLPGGGNPTMIAEVLGTARTVIIQRTSEGLDEDENPFTAYSSKPYYAPVDNRPPGYPKPSGGTPSTSGKTIRYGSGYGEYKSAGGFGSKPQLGVSGKMLGAIVWTVQGPTYGFLFFSSAEEAAKAHGHQFGTTTTERRFFGVDSFDSQAQLRAAAFKYLRQAAKRARIRLEGGIS